MKCNAEGAQKEAEALRLWGIHVERQMLELALPTIRIPSVRSALTMVCDTSTSLPESADSHSPRKRSGRTLNTPSSKSTRSAKPSSKSTGPELKSTGTSGSLLPTPSVNGNYNRKGASKKSGDGLATSLRAGSPASHSVMLDEEKERMMTATSGQQCFPVSLFSAHDGLLQRMSQDLLVSREAWFSKVCALTWKTKVTKFNRSLFQLAPSVRRTNGTEFGLLVDGRMLMTPKAGDGTFASGSTKGRARNRSTHLATQIKMLPTPSTKDASGGAVTAEKTPDGWKRTSKQGKSHGAQLHDVIKTIGMLPTPRARDTQPPEKSLKAREERGMHAGNDLPTIIKHGMNQHLKLQPAFALWMMGFPTDWCDLKDGEMPHSKPRATPSSRKSHNK